MTGPLNVNDVIDGRYQINSYIDKGGMQFVYKANDLILNRPVALKTPQNPSAEKRFNRSAIVAAKVNHPNVAKTLDYFEIDNRQYLIEELIEGGDLNKTILQKVKYADPYLVAKIFHYLAKGVAASHHVGVIHRDLKPTNVMVLGGLHVNSVKITDFGIAKMAEEELIAEIEDRDATNSKSQTVIGALPYMAPEVIRAPREVSFPADIWSLGAMMFELLTGNKPFGTGLMVVHKIIEAIPPEFPPFITNKAQFSYLSKELIRLILSCLQKDAATRPTADQLVEHCGKLCYPTTERHVGIVKEIRYNSWGFISNEEPDVFFNLASVYGENPVNGSNVWFSKFPGDPNWRAHPVVCLK